jgi:hypothetical protein
LWSLDVRERHELCSSLEQTCTTDQYSALSSRFVHADGCPAASLAKPLSRSGTAPPLVRDDGMSSETVLISGVGVRCGRERLTNIVKGFGCRRLEGRRRAFGGRRPKPFTKADTLSPCSANNRTIPAPIPRELPVMRATLSSSSRTVGPPRSRSNRHSGSSEKPGGCHADDCQGQEPTSNPVPDHDPLLL